QPQVRNGPGGRHQGQSAPEDGGREDHGREDGGREARGPEDGEAGGEGGAQARGPQAGHGAGGRAHRGPRAARGTAGARARPARAGGVHGRRGPRARDRPAPALPVVAPVLLAGTGARDRLLRRGLTAGTTLPSRGGPCSARPVTGGSPSPVPVPPSPLIPHRGIV